MKKHGSTKKTVAQALVIVGAGEPVEKLIDLVQSVCAFRLTGILDPDPTLRGKFIADVPVLGWLGDVPHHVEAAVIGAPLKPAGFDRQAVYYLLLSRGITLPALIAPSSRRARDAVVGSGALLLPGCRVGKGAGIGINNLIGTGAVIKAHTQLPDHFVVAAAETMTQTALLLKRASPPKTLNAVLAREHETLQDILQRINSANMEIVLIVDQRGALIGAITDGDIRRGFLAGVDLGQPVSLIMNRKPITVGRTTSHETMLRIMRERSIRHLPVIDEHGRPVRLERMETLIDDLHGGNDAVIMAGGLGSRLRPLTDDTPKPLLPVGDRPILDHILAGLRVSGIEDVILSLNYRGEQIRRHVGNGQQHDLHVNYVTEKQRLGTAGALSLIRPRPTKPFLVMNGDLLTNLNFAKLLRFQQESDHAMVICVRQYEFQVPYGVVDLENGTVHALREKPVYHHFINAGIYVLHPDCLAFIPENRYYDMTDLINRLLAEGRGVGAFPIIEYWRDIGRPEDLRAAVEEQSRLHKKNGRPQVAAAVESAS